MKKTHPIVLPIPEWIYRIGRALGRVKLGMAGLAIGGVLVMVLTQADSCSGGGTTANNNENQTSQSQLSIYEHNQPVPIYQNSELRQELIQIETQQANGAENWAVVVSNNGIPLFSCPIKGYPIPSTDQLTNPQQAQWDETGQSPAGTSIGQIEQTGVYTGNSAGTYIPCILPDGQVHMVYSEPNVMTYPYAVTIQNGQVVQTGQANSSTATAPVNNAGATVPPKTKATPKPKKK